MNVLIIGGAGTGKTWVMLTLINHFGCTTAARAGILDYVTNGQLCITGKYDGGVFQGSDKLSMSVMTCLQEYLTIAQGKTSIFEGDRFMNQNFIKDAKPIVLKIGGNGADGRKQRGSSQTTRQITALQSRVNNITPDYTFENSTACFEWLLNAIITNDFNLPAPPAQQSLF
jgi:hypothetical protein